jgi:endogenous inhibitor of DNA gyrase (YacG/DUF329 family)
MANSTSDTPTVKCPTCQVEVTWTPEQHWRPFCSERCKLIDLGSWFDESNIITGNGTVLPEHDD